jgi:hypothetical protein
MIKDYSEGEMVNFTLYFQQKFVVK